MLFTRSFYVAAVALEPKTFSFNNPIQTPLKIRQI